MISAFYLYRVVGDHWKANKKKSKGHQDEYLQQWVCLESGHLKLDVSGSYKWNPKPSGMSDVIRDENVVYHVHFWAGWY